jgi:hypothetical protein
MHLLVEYLEIPAVWRVGEAILYPAGWLAEHLDPEGRPWPEEFLKPLGKSGWPTIAVPVPRPGDADAIALARNVARDSLAVLDLYRGARLPLAPMEHQSFGLVIDVSTVAEHRWITDPNGALAQSSFGRFGTLGRWAFTQDDIDAFSSDPRFVYLDNALRAARPTDLEARMVSAIRTLALSRLVVRPALRVVLLATAIEALLGDPYQEGRPATGAHQLARRAAFASCGYETPIGRHGPKRVACDYLIANNGKELGRRLADRQAKGLPTECSTYWDLHGLFRNRGNALHGAALASPTEDVRVHEWVVRGAVLAVLDWITDTGATEVADYEASIRAVPRSQT